MNCPKCNSDRTDIIRVDYTTGNLIPSRRRCETCGNIFESEASEDWAGSIEHII